jgi:phage terminase large subunit GpA-like protein
MLVAESFDKRTGRFVNLKRQRNESLDTWGYAYAAALHPLVRIHMLRDSDWDKIEDKIQPKVLDLFATAPASQTDTTTTTTTASPVETPTPKPTPQRNRRQKGGYAKRY